MQKHKKMWLLFLVFLFIFNVIANNPETVTADDGSSLSVPYESYRYDYWENPVSSPQAYEPQTQISGSELGIGDFNSPRDLAVGPRGYLYLMDTGNSRVVVFDDNYEFVREISEFENQGQPDTFNNARGIDVTDEGLLYIADRDNERIVVLNEYGELHTIIGYPESDTIGEDFRYRPAKVGVAPDGRVFVVSDDVHEGVMFFDRQGRFQGFFGAPEVDPSLWEWFLRLMPDVIFTQERRERMQLLLPTEFTNLAVDDGGFVYATGPTDGEEVKLLSTSGRDVLRRGGFHPPSGDYGSSLLDEYGEEEHESSRLVDIISRQYGMYSVLDAERGRVFTYDRDGHLLYMFGGENHMLGTFRSPRALEAKGDKLLVLDMRDNRITVFVPTAYSQNIHQAIAAYNEGFYDRAEEGWRQALNLNANDDRAYTGMGRAYFRRDKFGEAMEKFRLGQNRSDYSRAFVFYRRDVLVENFNYVLWTIFGFVLLLILVFKFRIQDYLVTFMRFLEKKVFGEKVSAQENIQPTLNSSAEFAGDQSSRGRLHRGYSFLKRAFSSAAYARHVIVHPAGGFWDLKHEKKGSIPGANIILFLMCLTYVFMRQYTGFVFNPRDLTRLNILIEFATILIPLLLWCGVNWALTTLMGGKGTFTDIYIATCYALTPLILLNIPLTVISNFLTSDEYLLYFLVGLLSLAWTGMLIFMGTMVVHEYDLGATVLVIAAILLGIIISLFIGLLFFNVIEQFVSFLIEIYREVSFRM